MSRSQNRIGKYFKHMTKKAFTAGLLFAAAVLMGTAPASRAAALAGDTASARQDTQPVTHLNVGVTTPLSGNFFTGMWGRQSSDIDIRILLHSYNLVRWNGAEGFFEADPVVVKGLSALENQDGDRSFILTLMDDLYFSDGKQITAWDYAFSLLFGISPEIQKLGGIQEDRSYIAGYDDYMADTSRTLAGVRVLADDMLMITVSHEYLPFFYELGLLSCTPYPIQAIAPGAAVRDDGEGVYLVNEVEDADGDGIADAPIFTAELLKKTVLDPDTGYMSHPSVVSGPYRITEWDGITARFSRNEYYKDYTGYYLRYDEAGKVTDFLGETQYETLMARAEAAERDAEIAAEASAVEEENFPEETPEYVISAEELEKYIYIPYIEELSVTYVEDASVISRLMSEELDLVNKVTHSETIQEGLLMIRSALSAVGGSQAGGVLPPENNTADPESDEFLEEEFAEEEFLEEEFVEEEFTEEKTVPEEEAVPEGQRAEAAGGFNMSNYPRTGLGYISFACEREELTQAVRQAMAYCMNRDAVVRDYTGGFGLRVDSFYGIGQWMYGMVEGTTPVPVDPPEDENDAQAQAAYEEELAAWEALNLDGLNPYPLDLAAANALLDADGWYINEKTGIREKKIPLEKPFEDTAETEAAETAGDVEPAGDEKETEEGEKFRILTLDLALAYPEDVEIRESLENNWIPYLEQVGIRLDLVPMKYDKMLPLYYGWEDRSGSKPVMFFMASNFDVLFDPVLFFDEKKEQPEEGTAAAGSKEEAAEAEGSEPAETTEPAGVLSWGYTNLFDPELYQTAVDMRKTEPKAVLEYLQKWVKFQERFNELLPVLPVYSNVYFDFYSADLHDYAVTQNVSWSSKIVDAKLYHIEENEGLGQEKRDQQEGDESGTDVSGS